MIIPGIILFAGALLLFSHLLARNLRFLYCKHNFCGFTSKHKCFVHRIRSVCQHKPSTFYSGMCYRPCRSAHAVVCTSRCDRVREKVSALHYVVAKDAIADECGKYIHPFVQWCRFRYSKNDSFWSCLKFNHSFFLRDTHDGGTLTQCNDGAHVRSNLERFRPHRASMKQKRGAATGLMCCENSRLLNTASFLAGHS